MERATKICKDCGGPFTIEAEEMQWLNDKGLKVFSRCPICRGLRRDRRSDNDKVKETRVCTVCGDLFPITNGQAAWFDAREWGYPKKCPKCLKAQKEAAV